jgi:hypothetical protein
LAFDSVYGGERSFFDYVDGLKEGVGALVEPTKMSHASVSAVIAYWDAHDVGYLPGVSSDELLAFERKHGVEVPNDMRCFYRTTNGTHVQWDTGQDHESYDFYPLDEIAPDSDFPWAMTFANYRELSWSYAIDLSGAGGVGLNAVYFIGATEGYPLIVAHSFAEFLDLYVTKSLRLLPKGAATYHKSVTAKSR